jgi:quinol monooxygenase YgiN
VLRSQDDPARFALYEVYRTPDDVSVHQQTAHYARWKSTIDGLLAEPRHRAMFTTLLPPDGGW